MTTMEVLEMFAKFAASLAAVFAAVALVINACAFRLQKRSLRANLFNDIRKRVNELEDQWAEACKGELKDRERWYERLFSVFESFAFYANHDYLEKEMITFYATGIDQCLERLKKYSDLLKHMESRDPKQFCELEKYYEQVIKKPFPLGSKASAR
jgi:hypothetical protein